MYFHPPGRGCSRVRKRGKRERERERERERTQRKKKQNDEYTRREVRIVETECTVITPLTSARRAEEEEFPWVARACMLVDP